MKLPAAIALLAGLTACGQADEPNPETQAPTAVSLGAVEARLESLIEPVFGTGTIAPHKKTDLGPRVDGIVEEIHVRVGDRVEAGDPLFTTRRAKYEIRLREAGHAARLARAEAQKAKRDLARIEKLRSEGVASDERLDDVRTAWEIADARRGGAETALERAKEDLDNTVVRAPYPGTITQRYVDEGAMMSTMMSSSSLVVQIMKVDIVAAIVQIPEVHLPRVHVGTPARVRVDGTDREYETEVYILNDRVDHESRAFEVRLPIRNPDLVIKPGLFARAELMPEPREALVLERGAVRGPEGARFVWLFADGHANRRAILVRELDAARVEVLEGLSAGERALVGPNLDRVSEGTPVAVELAHADR